MSAKPNAMSNEQFYAFAYPKQNRRFYLALVFSVLLFPLIAALLVAGTIFLIVPIIVLCVWLAARTLFAHLVGTTVLVSKLNYPRIHAIVEELKVSMGYEKPVYVFVYESSSFNAFLRHMFFRRAIFLNSELLETGVSDNEMRWLVGRFIGYLRARRQAGVLGWLIRAAQHALVFNLFLLPYERAMVYTGDRLAVAAIDGDLSSAVSAMQKIFVGRELGYSINPEGIIEQQRMILGTFFAFLARMASAFPHVTSRYVDLMVFGKTFYPAQYARFEAANPGLPADLMKLGAAHQPAPVPRSPTRSRPSRQPFGWACATATMALLVCGAVLVRQAANGTYDTAYAAPIAAEAPALVAERQPEAAGISLPPNVHLDADNTLHPNPGCRWMTSDPNDTRVVCR
jgi:hypothetical protein